MGKKHLQLLIIVFLQLYYPIFSQDYIYIAQLKGKVDFITSSGNWYIDPLYEDSKGFINGIAAIKSNGKWGYINRKGEITISPRFDKAEPFENYMFSEVVSDQRHYYIGREGQLLSVSDTGLVIFNEDLAILKINGRYGYITKDNKWSIEHKPVSNKNSGLRMVDIIPL